MTSEPTIAPSSAMPPEYLTRIRRSRMSATRRDDLRTLVHDLIATEEGWADDAVIDLFTGEHGASLQLELANAAVDGLLNHGMSVSVVGTCIMHKRFELLDRLAGVGARSLIEASYLANGQVGMKATTPIGQWLDAFSRSVTSPRANFPAYVVQMVGHAHPRADTMADILVRCEPDHPDIAPLNGTAAGAVILAARLRAFLTSAPAAAAAGTPSHRRRRLEI